MEGPHLARRLDAPATSMRGARRGLLPALGECAFERPETPGIVVGDRVTGEGAGHGLTRRARPRFDHRAHMCLP